MWADCSQISIWMSVSWDKDPGGLISTCTLRLGPNENLSTIRQHCRPLPLDRYPLCLCLDDIMCLGLEGGWPVFDFGGWGGFFYRIDPSILANMLMTYPPIIICSKVGYTLTFWNVYHPLIWRIVSLRLRKIIVCQAFLSIGIFTINVFQYSTNYGYSINW